MDIFLLRHLHLFRGLELVNLFIILTQVLWLTVFFSLSYFEVSLATKSARPRVLCIANETGSWPLISRWVVAYDYCSRNFKVGAHFWMETVKLSWIKTRLWRIIESFCCKLDKEEFHINITSIDVGPNKCKNYGIFFY